jgi:ABC-type transport system substrate-binding protein
VLAALLALGLLAASCGNDDDGESQAVGTEGGGLATNLVDGGEPTPGGQLVIGIEAETDGWDPAANQIANAGYLVASAVYDPLMTATADGVEPFLAESMEHNEDYTEWTINLREGVTFHDGTEMDATDVAAGFEASREGLTSQYGWLSAESVEVVDPLTVQVNMKEPWAAFEWSMAGQSGFVRPSETIGDPDFANHPVGTGPFQFDAWEPNGTLNVVRNEDYWRPGLPYLDSIEYVVMTDPGTRSNALEAGDVDMIQTTSDEDILRFRTTEFTQVEDPDSEETMVMLNAAAPPFDNQIAREAVAYATDQQQIIDTVGSGIAIPASGPFSEDEAYFSDENYHAYDPERARELVQQYEQETGEPLSFDFTGQPDIETVALQQLLVSMWGDVGIEAEINTVEQQQLVLDIAQGGYQATWFRNFAYAQPDYLYLFWSSNLERPIGEISLNFTHYQDPELDDLLVEARSTQDQDVRVPLYQEAVGILNAGGPYIWLYHTPWALVARPGVHGLETPLDIGFARLDAKPWVGELWIEE